MDVQKLSGTVAGVANGETQMMWRSDLEQTVAWSIRDAKRTGLMCAVLRIENCEPKYRGAAVDACDRALRSGSVARVAACLDSTGLSFCVLATGEASVSSLASRLRWAVRDAGLGVGVAVAENTENEQEAARLCVMDLMSASRGAREGEIVSQVHSEMNISHALAKGEIDTWYQPVVRTHSGGVVGIAIEPHWEAGSDVSVAVPYIWGAAIAAGEAENLLSNIAKTAAEETADIRSSGVKLHLPVMQRHLETPGFGERMLEKLIGVPLEDIVIELAPSEGPWTSVSLGSLRFFSNLGCGLSMRGFGSGTSNIELLSLQNWSTVTLSSALVAHQAVKPELSRLARSAVLAVIETGAACGVEGVENPADAEHLTGYGVTLARGGSWSRPGPARVLRGVARSSVVSTV